MVFEFSGKGQEVDTAGFVEEVPDDKLSEVLHELLALQGVCLSVKFIDIVLVDILPDYIQILSNRYTTHNYLYLPSCHTSTSIYDLKDHPKRFRNHQAELALEPLWV